VGGGAAAVEIAFALASRAVPGAPEAGGRIVLATAGDALLPGLSRIAAGIAARSLARRGIEVRRGLHYVGVTDGTARFEPSGRGPSAGAAVGDRSAVSLPADLVVVATGGRPPAWVTASARAVGLPVGPDGGIAVGADLRSPADDRIFAAGDCASFGGLVVPKSGVHALRQGGPLAASILARLHGGVPAGAGAPSYAPQRRALALLDRGDGTAIAAWGPFGAAGAAFLRWKDRIDRGFVSRFPRDEASPSDGV
jgi:selenide,water dikinase